MLGSMQSLCLRSASLVTWLPVLLLLSNEIHVAPLLCSWIMNCDRTQHCNMASPLMLLQAYIAQVPLRVWVWVQ